MIRIGVVPQARIISYRKYVWVRSNCLMSRTSCPIGSFHLLGTQRFAWAQLSVVVIWFCYWCLQLACCLVQGRPFQSLYKHDFQEVELDHSLLIGIIGSMKWVCQNGTVGWRIWGRVQCFIVSRFTVSMNNWPIRIMWALNQRMSWGRKFNHKKSQVVWACRMHN